MLLLWKRSFVPSLQLSRALKETIRDPSEEEARLLAAGQRAQLLERLRGIDNGTTLLAETVARAAGSAEGVRAIAAYGEGLQRTYLSPDHLVPHFLRLAVETSESIAAHVDTGLVNMQEEIEPSPHELPLPATVAKAIYDRACALGATAASAADNLSLLRALLAVAICFMTMSRPISILLLPTTDLPADPDSAAHCVTVTRQHVKTDHGIDRNQPGRFPLSFPRRFAGLATALRNFTAARAAAYPTATHFFELPGERFTEKTNFGDALGRMLGTALTTVSLQPPAGRVYTARSLRSGGASAAEMVPLPRSKIEFLGGWAEPRAPSPEPARTERANRVRCDAARRTCELSTRLAPCTLHQAPSTELARAERAD